MGATLLAIVGVVGIVAGLGMLIDTFERAGQFSADRGAVRAGISAALMGLGAILFTFSIAGNSF